MLDDRACARGCVGAAARVPSVCPKCSRSCSAPTCERERGELTTALASYREALAIDAGWAGWRREGVDDVNRALRDAEFERLLSAGFSVLGAERFRGGASAISARRSQLRPDSREAHEGLAQAEQGAKLDQIALAEARALAFERRELWDQAIELYRSVLAADDTLLFAQTGLERAQARAGLDAKLANLIDNPTLLFGDAVLADARKLLEAAGAEEPRGPRLTGQIEQLGGLVDARFASPSRCGSTSDQLTHGHAVSCRHARCIRSRNELELRPGTYTVIGSRDGYRDVRQTFTVRPGRDLPPINVVCVEPI